MGLLNLCSGAVFAIIFYFLTAKVFSAEVDCELVEDCPIIKNILSRKYVPAPPNLWPLLKISKCDFDDGTDSAKIWCPKFSNCRTPDNQFGTCVPAQRCAYIALFLNISMTAELKVKLPFEAYFCGPTEDIEQHVCCPWPVEVSSNEIMRPFNFEEKENQGRRKRNANYPWLADNNNENTFFDDGESQFYNYVFTPENFNFELPNFSLKLPEVNSYSQQIPANNFYEKLKSNQKNTVNKFQILLQKQNKFLQNALQDQSKKIAEANGNNQNEFVNNWWKWFPGKNNNNDKRYNLTEETSDSKREICMTPDNFEGTCTQILHCPSLVKVLNKVTAKDSVQIEYLKKFVCGFDAANGTKVCCTEKPIVIPGAVSRTVESNSETKENSGNPLSSFSNVCGREIISNRIVGGTTTDLAEFPWTAVLYYTTSRGLTFGCGGIIISNRYILTAAHCVNSDILKVAGLEKLQSVVLGEYDRRNETDCIYTRFGSDCADSLQTFGVERIIAHELFKPNATPHDIALVRLDRDAIFSDYVRPICLSEGSINLKDNEMLTITGWGRTETGELSPVKRKATLPAIHKDNCNQLGSITDGQICLGSVNGTDGCKGDSGGPVMMHSLNKSNEPLTILVGIISFGFGRCGTTTSVSTYVPKYIDWILKNMS